MSMDKIKGPSRLSEWKAKRAYGEAISLGTMKKMETLIPILRRDATRLGIQHMTVGLTPESKKDWAAIQYIQDYRVRGDGVLSIPGGIHYPHDVVELLSTEELRALAWHEFGHYIYSYFFPRSDALYLKDRRHFLTQEMFCDEFAYKRFGDVMIRAQRKLDKDYGVPKGKTSVSSKDFRNMKRHKEKHGNHQ